MPSSSTHEEKKDDLPHSGTASKSNTPTRKNESTTQNNSGSTLIKALLERNHWKDKFSSTPIVEDSSSATDPSLTPSERVYLEQLLVAGDTQTLEAVSQRLLDPTLFFAHHATSETEVSAAAKGQRQQEKEASTAATKQEKDETTDSSSLLQRRDSAVQQQLFKWHEQTAIQPSQVLHRIATTYRSNSILDDNSSSNCDEAPSVPVETMSAANPLGSMNGASPRATEKDNDRNLFESHQSAPPKVGGDESTSPNNNNNNNQSLGASDQLSSGSTAVEVAVAEQQQQQQHSVGSQTDHNTKYWATSTVSSSFADWDPFFKDDVSSWLDGNQGIEVNDSGIPLVGSSPLITSPPISNNNPHYEQQDEHEDEAITDNVLARPAATTTSSVLTSSSTSAAAKNVTTSLSTSASTSATVGHYFRILGTCAEDVSCHPHVLSPPLMESLLHFVPESFMSDNENNGNHHNYWLKYSLVRDGANLLTMLRQCRASPHTILAIETVTGHVFGCFVGQSWRLSSGWYGSQDAFLWKMRKSRLEPTKSVVQQAIQESQIEVYPYRPGNVAVQYCSKECLMLGRGELLLPAPQQRKLPMRTGKHYGHALYLDATLTRGSTSTSETFGNPCLVDEQARGARFEVANLEVWTLTPHDTIAEAQQSELSTFFLEGGRKEKDLNVLGILVGGTI